jgi:hypothetical protein
MSKQQLIDKTNRMRTNCTLTNANEVGTHFVFLPEWLEEANALAICKSEINLYECEDMHKKFRIIYSEDFKSQYTEHVWCMKLKITLRSLMSQICRMKTEIKYIGVVLAIQN